MDTLLDAMMHYMNRIYRYYIFWYMIKIRQVERLRSLKDVLTRESLALPSAFAGTAAVRCDVAAPAITGAKLLSNSLENATFTG